MQKVLRAVSLALLLSVSASCGAVRVSAAGETLPVTPDPAGCTIAPRDLAEIGALWDGTPVTEDPPARTEVTLPVGTIVDDAATLDGVNGTIVGLFACLNAPDMARAFAYLTDDALVATFPWAIAAIAQGDPWVTEPQAPMPAEQRMTLLAIGPTMRLADGSVGTLVTFDDPSAEGTRAALYLELVLQGPIWTIDRVHPIQA